MTSCLSIGHARNGLAVFAHEFDGLRRPLDSGRLTTDDGKQNAFIFTLRYIDAFEATLNTLLRSGLITAIVILVS